MTLVRTSLLNAIAVVVRLLTLLGINKLLALYVGPTGYAALGQFQNVVQMITTAASGAINTGVVKYTAEHHANHLRQRSVWQTAGSITLIGSIFTGLAIALFSGKLAEAILHDSTYRGVFLWFGATLVLFTLNSLLLAILNGTKDIGRYILANISGSVLAFIVTAAMVIQFGLYGALTALAIYQSIAFFVTAFICYKAPWFKLSLLVGRIDKGVAVSLAKFTAMALTSATCVPVSHILIRNHLGETLGWEAAGHWEAISRLSAAYLMLATTTLSVYFLPRLSELNDPTELRKEILRGYKIILPFAAMSAIGIYAFRDLIIKILFTDEFLPMRDLFAWQMVGDTLKIGAWILAYLMLGKALTVPFVASEIIFSISLVLISYVVVSMIGLKGVAVAHAVNYFGYWVFVWWATKHLLVESKFSTPTK